jgi:hypothetical protein
MSGIPNLQPHAAPDPATDISTLQNDVNTLKDDVGTLQNDVDGLQARVGTLDGDVGGLQNDVGTLQGNVGTLEERVEEIYSNLDGVRNEFIEFIIGDTGDVDLGPGYLNDRVLAFLGDTGEEWLPAAPGLIGEIVYAIAQSQERIGADVDALRSQFESNGGVALPDQWVTSVNTGVTDLQERLCRAEADVAGLQTQKMGTTILCVGALFLGLSCIVKNTFTSRTKKIKKIKKN